MFKKHICPLPPYGRPDSWFEDTVSEFLSLIPSSSGPDTYYLNLWR